MYGTAAGRGRLESKGGWEVPDGLGVRGDGSKRSCMLLYDSTVRVRRGIRCDAAGMQARRPRNGPPRAAAAPARPRVACGAPAG